MRATDLSLLIDDMIRRRQPVDEREAESVERFRAELARLSDPCSETADPTHVTASAIIVGPRGLLLHRHKRLGIWLQPGGHIDDGEAPADAAIREAREETGVATEHFAGAPLLIHVDAHDGPRGHYHLDLRYLLAADDDHPTPEHGESPDARWWPWSEARTIDEPGLAGFISALMNVGLRPATPDDASAVAEVFLRSFEWAYRDAEVCFAHPPDDVRRWVRDEMLPGHDVTVAIAAGAVVGYCAVTTGWLSHLYVDPALVGLGVGKQLFAVAHSSLADGFDLWTFEANSRAQAFYERHGMVAVERTDGAGNEERQPDVRYRMTPSVLRT